MEIGISLDAASTEIHGRLSLPEGERCVICGSALCNPRADAAAVARLGGHSSGQDPFVTCSKIFVRAPSARPWFAA
jgi:hypothetical protein